MSLTLNNSITDITESMFDRQWRDMEFCYDVMEQHREMEQFVNECLIKASGNKRAINEMYILNEGAFTDKIKAFFTKIKDFFKKIFAKLGASMNALFLEQKKYIDKYAFIVTKCKWNQGDVSDVKDRFKAIARILDAVEKVDTAVIGNNMDKFFKGEKITESDGAFIDNDTFSSADKIGEAYKDEKKRTKLEKGATRDETFNEFIKDGYWSSAEGFDSFKETDSNNNVDIGATFANWFEGSRDTVSWTADEVEDNFQTIINTAYAGESYIKKLQNIVDSVEKKMDDAAKTMENYHKSQSEKIKRAVAGQGRSQKEIDDEKAAAQAVANAGQGTAGQGGAGQGTAGQGGAGQGTAGQGTAGQGGAGQGGAGQGTAGQGGAGQGAANASYIYQSRNDFPINEMKFGENNAKKSDTASPPTKAGKEDLTKATASNDKVKSMTTNKMDSKEVGNTTGIDNNNKSTIEKQANELLEVDIYNREVKINESINISSTIVRKMFDAFKNTNSDFFKIIQAHVQWYLSNPGEKDKSENQQLNRPRSLDGMNTGSTQVTKTKPENPTS